MAGSSFSTNNSSGQSTSSSSPIQTPQSEWGLQLSQLLNALANNQYQWAMDQYNTGKEITNQNIHQYMDLAGKGSGLADQLINQYQDQFKPLMDEYIRQAGTYNSEGRQRFMMGQAESTVAQADQKARDEAERKLQGFGINPNSGRYQDLMLTSRIQDAAARAGAGTQAALDTADRGRAMTEKAAAMGQNIPGMAVNALQSAYTGVTGAENAILGMINTGTNATGSAAPFANAASGAIKNPSQGTQAQSTQASTGVSRSSTSDPSKSGNDKSGGRQPSDSSGGGRQPNTGSSPDGNRVISPKQMTNPYQPGAGVKKKDDSDNGGVDENQPPPMPYFDENGNLTPFADPQFARDAGGDMYTPQTTPWNDLPQAPNWAPSPEDFGAVSPDGMNNVEPGANQPGAWTPESPTSPQPANPDDPWGSGQDFTPPQSQPTSGDFGGDFYQPQQDYSLPQQDWQQPDQDWQPQFDDSQMWGPSDDTYQPESGTQDFSPNYDDSGSYGEEDQNDYYGGGDYSGYDEESYARGGRVRGGKRGVLPTTGGHVSRGASPSRGRVTDDVPARLNAGEFVVPRDVVAHKGSEFFQNLIAKSRKLRTGMTGAPARGKMKPALPNMHRPRFVSRQMGAQR